MLGALKIKLIDAIRSLQNACTTAVIRKRGITVLVSLGVLVTVGYFMANKWAIHHESMTFLDPDRDNRPVAVDIAVRRDKEMQANAGMVTLPVAILNHGNTVKNTEYSFLANDFAARGYIVVSIQHDLPTDAPMVTKVGELYVGRLQQIERGVANIKFAVEEMKKVQPNADYNHLTVVGHSMGGDITMYFAKQYPDHVRKVVTLDNLRVPFITSGKFKILSFRSRDPQFKTDPGVVPSEDVCEKVGITVVRTNIHHNDMRDAGSEGAKTSIEGMLDKFLADTDNASDLKPIEASTPKILDPGPVAPYVPTGNEAKLGTSLTHS
jgi:Chlorophyllase enzyme